MGTELYYNATPGYDFRDWLRRALPLWLDGWREACVAACSPGGLEEEGALLTDENLAYIAHETRKRPMPPGLPAELSSMFSDAPKAEHFGVARRLLSRGGDPVVVASPEEGDALDELTGRLIQDTRYCVEGSKDLFGSRARLRGLEPLSELRGSGSVRWHSYPEPDQIPGASDELLRLWAFLHSGRSARIGSGEDCHPDAYDHIHGWFTRDECAILVRELAPYDDETPLIPRSERSREAEREQMERWLAKMEQAELPPDLPSEFPVPDPKEMARLMRESAGVLSAPDRASTSALLCVREAASHALELGGGMYFYAG